MVHLLSNLSDLILLEMVVLGSELECTDLVVVDWDRIGTVLVPTILGTAVAGTALVPTIGLLAKLDFDSPSPLQWNGNWMRNVLVLCQHILVRCLRRCLLLNDWTSPAIVAGANHPEILDFRCIQSRYSRLLGMS